ncbi:hypothetical protein SH668x_001111 [Planctomicrobium sp. SH668]|uniref:hypothetical protein n=1 Tax=Planctomicrobium sp. SH668 TaxID=3448126 RepID=UPI003F5B1568
MFSVFPLWLPLDGAVQIPWLQVLCRAPLWLDNITLGVMVAGAISLVVAGSTGLWPRVGLWCYTIGLAVLVLMDQHRLQPWACQYLLFGVLFLVTPKGGRICYWRWIILSIYFWSAVSKVDLAFLKTQGQLLLNGIGTPLGIDLVLMSEKTRLLLAAMMPASEFLIVLLLLVQKTRIWGLLLSLVMHSLLIFGLAVGLKHEWSVVIWNLYFIVQNLIVFWSSRPIAKSDAKIADRRDSAALFLSVVFVSYPGLELVGCCDHWPAWCVYSSRQENVRVMIDEEAAASLPEHLQRYLGKPGPLEERVPFNLEAWSFSIRSCPIYPQGRYRLALILGLLGEYLHEESLSVEIRNVPNRWTGHRVVVELHGMGAIRQYCDDFVLNTVARGD